MRSLGGRLLSISLILVARLQPLPERPVIAFTPINVRGHDYSAEGKKRPRKSSKQSISTSLAKAVRPGRPSKAPKSSSPRNYEMTEAFLMVEPTSSGFHPHGHGTDDAACLPHGNVNASSMEPVLDAATREKFLSWTYRGQESSLKLAASHQASPQCKGQKSGSNALEPSSTLSSFSNLQVETLLKQLHEPEETTMSSSHLHQTRNSLSLKSSSSENALCKIDSVNFNGEQTSEAVCEVPCTPEVSPRAFPFQGPSLENCRLKRQESPCHQPSIKLEVCGSDQDQNPFSSRYFNTEVFDSHDIDDITLPHPEMDDYSIDDDTVEEMLLLAQKDSAEASMDYRFALNGPTDPVADPNDFSNLSDLSFEEPTVLASSPSAILSSSPYLLQDNFDLDDNFFPWNGPGKALSLKGDDSDKGIYDDEEIDTEFLNFQTPPSAQMPPPSPPPSPSTSSIHSSTPKLALPPSRSYTPASSPAKSPPAQPKPDLGTKSERMTETPANIPHLVSFDDKGTPIPFLRPPFPNPIKDRSRVAGLNSNKVLRICFRIGEALNAAAAAYRHNTDAIIELYACVSHSERPAGSFKQSFQFVDLFTPTKPPFLSGLYMLWKSSDLWDFDSRAFLGDRGPGKMARVVGRIKRSEMGREFEMLVLSIWEVDWEDVGVAKGHLCGS